MSKAKELSELGDAVTVDSGNVGIGQASPSATLDVNGHINLTDGYELKWGGAGATIYGSHSNNELRLYTNNTAHWKVESTGNLRPYTNGVGINFDASEGSNATSTVLDDYEEGTWTPAIEGLGSNPSISYTLRTGWYTKVGNTVNIWCYISINTFSGGSGTAVITDLPFTSSSVSGKLNFGAVYANNVLWGSGAATQLVSYIGSGASYIRLQGMQNNTGDSDIQVTNFASGDAIGIHVAYTV
jgi:hypothetical protein